MIEFGHFRNQIQYKAKIYLFSNDLNYCFLSLISFAYGNPNEGFELSVETLPVIWVVVSKAKKKRMAGLREYVSWVADILHLRKDCLLMPVSLFSTPSGFPIISKLSGREQRGCLPRTGWMPCGAWLDLRKLWKWVTYLKSCASSIRFMQASVFWLLF